MVLLCLAVLMLVDHTSAQYGYGSFSCPPDDASVARFRQLTDIREPLHLPYIDDVLRDAAYADPEFTDKLADVDLPWIFALPNITIGNPFAPFVSRCCETDFHACNHTDIILHYVKYQNGICWVVWPERRYVYKRCTCCACLLREECPVVGRCVESDFTTVPIIAYCRHIMYSDRFIKLALRLPNRCRCNAQCPVPEEFIYNHPDGLPNEFDEMKVDDRGRM